MAISDALKDGKKTTAPQAPKAPAKGSNDKSAAFKESGAAQRAQMTEDQKAMEGSKSDKVAFVCALGDPNRKQARVENGNSIPSYVVVGYQFKVLEDMTVPYAPIKADFKSPLDVEAISERQVKAGEVVSLNIVETADFISRIEFAGRFTGEGTGVSLSAKVSNDRPEPLPILVKIGDGSIKENMVLIADMIGANDAENIKGTPRIKEEFAEAFGVLYSKKSIGKKSTGANKKAGEGQADIAAAFRALYASKRA